MASKPFVDDNFPRNQIRRTEPSSQEDDDDTNKIEWRRVVDIYPDAATQPLLPEVLSVDDIRQGEHPDCFFVTSVIALVRADADLVRNLFVSKEVSDVGKYTLRFFRWNAWTEVTVDDCVPVVGSEKTGFKPLFVRSPTERIWPLILEKAFAKFHTSFASIEGGNVPECLHDLTSAPVLQYTPQSDAATLNAPLEWMKWRHLLLSRQVAITAGTKTGTDATDKGLQPGHAFTIVAVYNTVPPEKEKGSPLRITDMVVKLRNPTRHSPMQYKGQYSRADAKTWKDEKLCERLEYSDVDKNDDAVFYMTVPAFLSAFNSLHVCLLTLRADTIGGIAASFEGEWNAASAGGNSTFTSFRRNPQYVACNLSKTAAAEVLVLLQQPDQRPSLMQREGRECDYLPIGVTTVAATEAPEVEQTHLLTMNNHKTVDKSTFRTQRDTTIRLSVAAGATLTVVPSTFAPKCHSRFSIRFFPIPPATGDTITFAPKEVPVDSEPALTISEKVQEGGVVALSFALSSPVAHLQLVLRQEDHAKSVSARERIHDSAAAAAASSGDTIADAYLSISTVGDASAEVVAAIPVATNYRELGLVAHGQSLKKETSFTATVKCPKLKTPSKAGVLIALHVFVPRGITVTQSTAQQKQTATPAPPPAPAPPAGKAPSKAIGAARPAATPGKKAAPTAPSGAKGPKKTAAPAAGPMGAAPSKSMTKARAGLGGIASMYADL